MAVATGTGDIGELGCLPRRRHPHHFGVAEVDDIEIAAIIPGYTVGTGKERPLDQARDFVIGADHGDVPAPAIHDIQVPTLRQRDSHRPIQAALRPDARGAVPIHSSDVVAMKAGLVHLALRADGIAGRPVEPVGVDLDRAPRRIPPEAVAKVGDVDVAQLVDGDAPDRPHLGDGVAIEHGEEGVGRDGVLCRERGGRQQAQRD